jgi:enoyl-[acyl-carrier protein] reductase II
MLRNRFTEYWAQNEAKILPYPRQLQEVGASASIRGRIEGDVENGVLPAGQSTALVHSVKPAATIIDDILAEARQALRVLEG